MTDRRVAERWRRRLAVALAAFTLAALALLLPAATPEAHAAEELRIGADTTYRVDPADAVVRVRMDVKLTNLKPNGIRRTAAQVITTRYYYDRVLFNVQREARSIRASSGGSALRVSVDTKATHRLLTVHIPDLYFRQSRTIRIEYELPGGKPRSTGDIRVGAAFVTFTAWSWGDPGRSTVRIVLPKGFTNSGYGETLKVTEEADRVLLTTGQIADPAGWYAVVIADRPAALTDVRAGTTGSPIVVRAWPEDTAWRDQVRRVLDTGVPVLHDLIALEWPVPGDLTVTEVHTPLLEGYAGIYSSLDDTIRISEELDTHTILHEASHAWFDEAFVDERWIVEGLAEEYAARARATLDLDGPAGPDPAAPDDKAAFRLDDWPQPGRIDGKDAAARESFGYAASWIVMRAIVEEAGEDGMRAVFAAIELRTIPYVGDRAPETAGRRTGWRQFLDLAQEVGGAEGAEALFRTWVVAPSAIADLDARTAARDAYHELAAAGGDWAPPYLVRERLWSWAFQEATDGMAAAADVLDDRAALSAVSARLGASTPNDVEARFEEAGTVEALDALETNLEHRADVAETLIAARDQLAAPRTPLAGLGLAGAQPVAGLDAAVAAFSAGDLEGAVAGSAETTALLAGAEEVGRGRALAAGAVAAGLALLLVLAAWLVRRRRRGQVLAGGRGRPGATSDALFARASDTVDDIPDPVAGLGISPDAPTTLAATPDPAAAGAAAPPAGTPLATTPASTVPIPGADPD